MLNKKKYSTKFIVYTIFKYVSIHRDNMWNVFEKQKNTKNGFLVVLFIQFIDSITMSQSVKLNEKFDMVTSISK